jgi:hypothetical protein
LPESSVPSLAGSSGAAVSDACRRRPGSD